MMSTALSATASTAALVLPLTMLGIIDASNTRSAVVPRTRRSGSSTAAAIPKLIEAGGGSIVGVSAKAAFAPFSGAAGYITSKAAVWAFISALAAEYKDDAIRANAILPSVIDTPGNRESQPDSARKGWVSPETIAETVAFLVSDASAAVTGAQVPVPGVG